MGGYNNRYLETVTSTQKLIGSSPSKLLPRGSYVYARVSRFLGSKLPCFYLSKLIYYDSVIFKRY